MQLRTIAAAGACALAVLALPGEVRAGSSLFDDQQADTWFQYFYGSDDVAVRSLIGSMSMAVRKSTILNVQWNNEQVDIPGVSAPPGSQEAIDAITTASRPISGNAYEDFTKTRNEVTSELTQGPSAVSYYISKEEDYLGQQVGAKHSETFADQLLNVQFAASYGWDSIKPLADDDTNTRPDTKTTVHMSAVATRIVSPSLQMRFGLEYNVVDGLQHNPYRNVYAGGTTMPENHPDHRERRDVFVDANKYFTNRSSLRLNYRLYDDDWGILSHEIGTQLSQYVTHGVFASWRYRYYTQTPATFYRPEYATVDGIDGYRTGDYRMSDLSSNLFGFGLNFDLAGLAFDNATLRRMGIRFDYERYFNNLNYSANFLTTQLVYHF